MDILLTSSFSDSNIFHIFGLETHAIWDKILENRKVSYSVFLENFPDTPPHRWRRDLIASTVPVYTAPEHVPGNFDRYEELECSTWIVDPCKFRKYRPSSRYIQMAKSVKEHLGIKTKKGSKILLITREDSRILYDFRTRRLFSEHLEDFCLRHKLPCSIENFDDCPLSVQAEAVSEARVVIASHGAANTNLFLMPDNGHLFEINFRKHWHCDPVCDDHFQNVIPYRSKCAGRLSFSPSFHKADYHNLARLFGKRYTEIELSDADTFLSRNPISLKNLFVDSEKILSAVKREMLR